MSGLDSGAGIARIPDFELSQLHFLVKSANVELVRHRSENLNKLMESIKLDKLGPYYYYLYHDLKLPELEWDQLLYDSLVAGNQEEIEKLNTQIKEKEDDDEGETELLNCWVKLGEYYTKIGDRTKGIEALRKALSLAPSTGTKIDILLTITRIGFFFDDAKFIKQSLDELNLLIEKGGDWERKNRYKTYLGIYLMSTRNFKEASKLLIESLATFTSTELTTYENVAKYALITGAIALPRNDLKKKLIDSPEILSIDSTSDALKPIYKLISCLYLCDYKVFFKHLLDTNDQILLQDKYLAPHSNYYIRELRVRAYAQLLESYKSLSLKSMAEQFQISVEFLDSDLIKFIPNKKLNCVIDKVNGIIETNRPDNKNNQYQFLIKNGDGLLTKLQKYGAAVRLSGAEQV